ncbi:MAG TPA: energy transducer TonB [Gemmatimonadota bacterium]|nr:energy transducer TonB [Gemmatimonadota bacterium]
MAERVDRPVAETTGYTTANTELHGAYGRYFKVFTIAAVLVHGLLIFFLVTPRGEGFEARAEELTVIDIPPEIRIPPPPEEIARPATPVIAEEPIEEDITIAETEIEANEPVPEAPPAPPAETVGNTFTFTPYTVKPKCKTNCTADDILRHVPPLLQKSGVQCDLAVGLRIDTGGNVTATQILKTSNNQACDAATEKWARTTAWTTAYNRDQPVVVWISQPVSIKTE